MDHATVIALSKLNRRFYRTHGDEFSRTRHSPWRGWERVFDLLRTRWPEKESLRILDMGCGNGRFLRYFGSRWPHELEYHGIDFQVPDPLVRRELEAHLRGRACWHQHDFVLANDPIPPRAAGEFDLVCLFGVMHHVPSLEKRRSLLGALASRLHSGGVLVTTLWQFAAHPRFRQRILPWAESGTVLGVPVRESELEPGDHLLAWGSARQAARYCHHVEVSEWHALTRDLRMRLVDEFCSDGASGDLNEYKVLARP